jgi:hypothetical protein
MSQDGVKIKELLLRFSSHPVLLPDRCVLIMDYFKIPLKPVVITRTRTKIKVFQFMYNVCAIVSYYALVPSCYRYYRKCAGKYWLRLRFTSLKKREVFSPPLEIREYGSRDPLTTWHPSIRKSWH